MFEHYLNKELFENKIFSLIPKNVNKIESVVIDIKDNTIIKDCTKLLLDNVRYNYINNQLIKI